MANPKLEQDRQAPQSGDAWANKHIVPALIVCVATVAATYAIIKVLLIDEMTRQRDAALATAEENRKKVLDLSGELGRLDARSVGAREEITKLETMMGEVNHVVGQLNDRLGASAIKTPVVPQRRFLGQEDDACGGKLVVHGRDGPVEVQQGESKDVPITLDGDGFFHWRCGDSEERTHPPSTTNLIVCSRDSSGRSISWACYLIVD